MSEELERAYRDGLRLASERVDPKVPLAELAHDGVRRRRRRRWTIAGAAAASLVVVAGATTAAVLASGGPARRADDHVTTPHEPETAWRAESWRNLTVDVPADWGWGTAETHLFDQHDQMVCGGPGEMVTPDGRKRVNPDAEKPWVGRPIMLSDVCLSAPYPTPVAPYVWLGADIPPGHVDLGGGYVQETVAAFGSTLTVTSDDPALRTHVIESARPTTGCSPHLPTAPWVESMLIEGIWKVRSARVCAYQRTGRGYDLTYATDLDESAAVETHAGVYAGQRRSSPGFCPEGGDEYVVIMFTGDDRYGPMQVSQKVVISPDCQEVQGAPGLVSPLSEAAMEPWSRNGLQAVLRSFIGMLG